MSVLVRDRVPLRLHATVRTPAGIARRWGPDERRPDDTLSGLVFSSTAPGGYEQASNQLARRILMDFPDLEELSTVTFRGVGGEVAWEGRLEGSPRTWGDQSGVQPQLVGHQAHLTDNNSAREIFVDQRRQQWQAPSVQRQINLITASTDEQDPGSQTDQATGYPSVVTAIQAPIGRQTVSEAWYDANGIALASLYFAWKLDGNISSADTAWQWSAGLADDDVLSASDTSGNLRAAGPGRGTVTASAATRKWALAQLLRTLPSGLGSGSAYNAFWTVLAAYGRHGLPLQSAGDYQNAPGVLASDVVANVVSRWAPLLKFTLGTGGTIIPSTFEIPQLAFLDPTTASAMLTAATAFELQDWYVWNDKTFWWYPRGTYGRAWRAQVGPSQLQETGPSISRLWNGVVVTYTDVSGITRSVGPPGSGANTEDASLLDSDPENPANQITANGGALRRWGVLQMSTATVDMAVKVGAIYLQEQKLLDTSGQATITGHVQDASTGIWMPAWMIRAGDTIRFTDSNDTSPRRIIRSEWNNDARQCSIALDSPPDGLQQLLERLGVELSVIGF